MATPKDAAYKVEQRDLRARAKKTPLSQIRYDGNGQAVNPARRERNAKKAAA